MQKIISKEIKEEILNRIKTEGVAVTKLAEQYGISDKTIYRWLKSGISSEPNIALEMNKLRRENEDLLLIIGKLTADELRKKKRY